jgi:hypothetical protein
MPTGSRVRSNNVFGLVSDSPLSSSATALNSNGLANLPAIAGTQHAVITLDPLRVNGAPEIILVTNHASLSSVATVTRGAYNTTARSHSQGTLWTHTPMNEDYTQILTSGTRPADPYNGQEIYETDTNRIQRWSSSAWGQAGLLFDPPACRVTNSVNQSIPSGIETGLTFDTEVFDTDTMHDTVSLTGRITIKTAGLYLVTAGVGWANTAGIGEHDCMIFWNGLRQALVIDQPTASAPVYQQVSVIVKAAVTDIFECRVYQNTGGAINSIATTGDPMFSALWVGRGN